MNKNSHMVICGWSSLMGRPNKCDVSTGITDEMLKKKSSSCFLSLCCLHMLSVSGFSEC